MSAFGYLGRHNVILRILVKERICTKMYYNVNLFINKGTRYTGSIGHIHQKRKNSTGVTLLWGLVYC